MRVVVFRAYAINKFKKEVCSTVASTREECITQIENECTLLVYNKVKFSSIKITQIDTTKAEKGLISVTDITDKIISVVYDKKISIGIGATKLVGEDMLSYTVVEVIDDNKVRIQRDKAYYNSKFNRASALMSIAEDNEGITEVIKYTVKHGWVDNNYNRVKIGYRNEHYN